MPVVDHAHVQSEILRLKNMLASNKSKLDLGSLMGGDSHINKSIVDLVELQNLLIGNLIEEVEQKSISLNESIHLIQNKTSDDINKLVKSSKEEVETKLNKSINDFKSNQTSFFSSQEASIDKLNEQLDLNRIELKKDLDIISNKTSKDFDELIKINSLDADKKIAKSINDLKSDQSNLFSNHEKLIDKLNQKLEQNRIEFKGEIENFIVKTSKDFDGFAKIASSETDKKVSKSISELDSNQKKYFSEHFEKFNSDFLIVSNRLNSLSDTLKADIGSISNNFNSLSSRYDVFESKLSYIERSIEKLDSIDELNGKLEVCQQKLNYVERDYTYLRDRSDSISQELGKIGSGLQNIESRTESSENKISELSKSLSDFSEGYRSAISDIEALKSNVSSSNALPVSISNLGGADLQNILNEFNLFQNALSGFDQRSADISSRMIQLENNSNEFRIDLMNLKNYIDVVSSNIDSLNYQFSNLSMRIYALANSTGLMMGQDIENYNSVDRLQDVLLRQRAQLTELEFRDPEAMPEPRVLKMRKPRPVKDIWKAFEELAPHNFDHFKTAFEVGAASYVGFPPESCSTSGVHQADQFEAFLLPYLMRSRATLDIGCGPQAIPSYLRKANIKTLHGVDLLAPYEEHPFVFAQTAGEFLPWDDESFDLIASGGAVDHYYLLDQGMKEANRVLTPGGHYVLSITLFDDAPFYDPYSYTIKPYDSEHLFHVNRSWFDEFMGDHGFKLVEEMTFHLPFVYGLLAFKKVS